ncbi:MAG: hypothetical protein M5U12_04075 [Verrucomicrobia bacterium]|nr:hypothetical protein [Verrucomicrobiota bacterium]
MLNPRSLLLATVFCGGADPGPALANDNSSPTRIPEFLASNGADLQDDDGDHPDWIELEVIGQPLRARRV